MSYTVNRNADRQVTRWSITRHQANQRPAPPPPLITISRQYGSRGAGLGHELASHLGFSYWNRELIIEMARHAHGALLPLIANDEHHRPELVAAIAGMMYSPTGAFEFVRELGHVVHELDRRGGAVIVGHGAQYVLPPERALRVRVVSALDRRIAGLMASQGLNRDDAARRIEEVDRDRRDFVRDSFGRDIDDPGDYDLWIDTGTLGLTGGAEVASTAYRVKFPPLPPPR